VAAGRGTNCLVVRFFRVRTPEPGVYFEDVGFLADGSLYNPNGYPEETVRRSIEDAQARITAARKASAAKAALTRKRRRERQIYSIAKKILAKQFLGPRRRCAICEKVLSDPVSIERGIGSECWGHVLEAIERTRGESRQAIMPCCAEEAKGGEQ
jgi:hypothetical protein